MSAVFVEEVCVMEIDKREGSREGKQVKSAMIEERVEA
jgi:hypothetical protein